MAAFVNIPGATGATLADSGLTPLTGYTYRRKVTDTTGTVAYSNEITVTTNAGLSGGTISEITHAVLTADFQNVTAASNGAAPYTYQWKRKLGAGAYASLGGETGLALADTGLAGLTTYTWKRVTTDADGSTADSNEVTVTTNAALAGGTIAAGTHTDVYTNLTNSAAASGGAGSIVYQWQSKTSGAFADIGGETGLTLHDIGLVQLTAYTYRRRATDGLSTIAYSNEITITTDATVTGSVVVFDDTFNRTDQIPLGTPSDAGVPWVDYGTASFGIDANGAISITGVIGDITTRNASDTNAKIRMVVQDYAASQLLGAVMRFSTAAGDYLLPLAYMGNGVDTGFLILYQVVGGVGAEVGRTPTESLINVGSVIEVSVDSVDDIRMYLDGVLLGTFHSTAGHGNTEYGLRMSALGTVRWGSFKITTNTI